MNSQQMDFNEDMNSNEEWSYTVTNINRIHEQLQNSTLDSVKNEHNEYWNIINNFFNIASESYTLDNLKYLRIIQAHMLYLEAKNITTNLNGGRRRNNSTNTDMKMKDVKILCKKNQIKLSTTVNDKRVVYTKKELITKLKRKKAL